MDIKDLIIEFSKTRPDTEIIVGYGSKVKSQANDKGKLKQIDLIIGVNNALEWHKQNHELNPEDYKSTIGYKLLPVYANWKTDINYLSYIPFENHMFKIGVVEVNDLYKDLMNWENFFLAGRFQKPIEVIKGSNELNLAIKMNRLNALKTSLLMCGKENITEKELYETLCSLSFIGDWRNILHVENKNKVKNIVDGSFLEFQTMYKKFDKGLYENNDDVLEINYEYLLTKIHTLPDELKHRIFDCLYNRIIKINSEEQIKEEIKKTIIKYFTEMNLVVTAAQPIKGLILNGPSKSLTYIGQKLSKK